MSRSDPNGNGRDRRRREASDPHYLNRKNEAFARYAAKPENKLKIQARNKVKHLCRVGKMQRGNCECCGQANAEAHHEDYTKPLDVRWLCRTCHIALHRDQKRAQ